MKESLVENTTYDKFDYSENLFAMKSYENCLFKNGNFSEAELSKKDFLDCTFENCNWSNVKIVGTSLKNITFINGKLLGVDFSLCADFLFQVKFINCNLDYTYFLKRKLKNTLFDNCEIKEANFSEADLNSAVFKNCNLDGSIFFKTNLANADFRTSLNYSINPEENNIKRAKFSYPALLGLLDKYQILVD